MNDDMELSYPETKEQLQDQIERTDMAIAKLMSRLCIEDDHETELKLIELRSLRRLWIKDLNRLNEVC